MEPLLKARLIAIAWDEEVAITGVGVPRWGDMPTEEQEAILEELEEIVLCTIEDIVAERSEPETAVEVTRGDGNIDD